MKVSKGIGRKPRKMEENVRGKERVSKQKRVEGK